MITLVLFLALMFISSVFFVATEKYFFCIVDLIATAVGVYFLFDVNIVAYVQAHPMEVLKYALGYFFVAGAGWAAALKWPTFLLAFKDERAKATKRYEAGERFGAGSRRPLVDQYGHVTPVRPEQQSLKEFLSFQNYLGNPLDVAPKAANNKERIMAWIAFWPASIVATVVGDYLRNVVEWVYRIISGTLDRISKSIVGDVAE